MILFSTTSERQRNEEATKSNFKCANRTQPVNTANNKTNHRNKNLAHYVAPSVLKTTQHPKKTQTQINAYIIPQISPHVREGARALNKHARRQYLESVIGLFDFSTHQQRPLWPTGVARFTSSAFEFVSPRRYD